MRRDRHWLAVLIAPLGVLPAAACALGAVYVLKPAALEPGLALSVLVAFYGLPISYLVTTFFGLPIAWLLWRSGRRSLIVTVVAGTILGTAVAAIPLGSQILGRMVRYPGSLLGATNAGPVSFAVALFALCGAFVSCVYWLVGLNRAAERTPLGAR
jgi:hypothetical protein